jgi:hypothetical protein
LIHREEWFLEGNKGENSVYSVYTVYCFYPICTDYARNINNVWVFDCL